MSQPTLPSNPKKRKTEMTDEKRAISVAQYLTQMTGTIQVMTKDEDVDLIHQTDFTDGLTEKELEVINTLPFWQSTSFQQFNKHCLEGKDELSENLLLLTPLPSTLLKKLREYILACKKKEPYTPSPVTTSHSSTTTSSMPAPGDIAAADAIQAPALDGLAGLLSYEETLGPILTVSSSISAQKGDSYTIYTAEQPFTKTFMELNLYPTTAYVACQDGRNRWRLADQKIKAPLNAKELMMIRAVQDSIANRLKNSASLQLKRCTRT